MKTRSQLRQVLINIFEKAKVHRDLSDSEHEQRRWNEIVEECYEALDRPSAAGLDKILEDAKKEGLKETN
jgi:hypothetical protein